MKKLERSLFFVITIVVLWSIALFLSSCKEKPTRIKSSMIHGNTVTSPKEELDRLRDQVKDLQYDKEACRKDYSNVISAQFEESQRYQKQINELINIIEQKDKHIKILSEK